MSEKQVRLADEANDHLTPDWKRDKIREEIADLNEKKHELLEDAKWTESRYFSEIPAEKRRTAAWRIS